MSHIALILAGVAAGESRITGLSDTDCLRDAAQAMQALGASIHREGEAWVVHGTGNGCLLAPDAPLNFGSSGAGALPIMALAGVYDFETRFVGNSALPAGSMPHVLDALKRMGVQVDMQDGEGMRMSLNGPHTAAPLIYRVPVASEEVKSAILLAGLNTPGTTTVVEPSATHNRSEKMLAQFGATIEADTAAGGVRTIRLEGRGRLSGQVIDVPGDPSLAAFAIVAALIVPGSNIKIRNMLMNATRDGLINTLQEMGGLIEVLDRRQAGGAEAADLRIRSSALQGVTVPAGRLLPMIQNLPALAVAASFATGETRIEGLGDPKQLEAVAQGLRINGAACDAGPDWLRVTGRPDGKGLGGATANAVVDTRLDPHIAMGFLVMGLASEHPVTIADHSIIATCFPGFIEMMRGLGAEIELK